MTPAQPAHCQPRSAHGAMDLHGLQRISTARRVEPAPRPQQRADELAVASQQHHKHSGGRCYLPHITTLAHGHPLGLPPCRRSKAPITRSRSAARSAWQATAARGLARNTSRLPPGSELRYPRARCRSWRRTLFRTTAGPTALLTTNPTRAGRLVSGSTSRCPDTSERPVRLPRLVAESKSARRRIRAAAG